MLSFLHIPKTGGCARRSAILGEIIAGTVLHHEHERVAATAPGELVLYVRDPLTKFVSGFDAFEETIRGTMIGQEIEYPTINEFVEDFEHAMRDCGETCRLIFRPQAAWDAPARDDVIRLKMEHMDVSFPQLLAAYGLKGTLPARTDPSSNTYSITKLPKSVLNETSVQFIREFYDEDFPLWEAAQEEYDAP